MDDVTGLRPGEKLFEELLIEGEGIIPTAHDKIKVLAAVPHNPIWLAREMGTLFAEAAAACEKAGAFLLGSQRPSGGIGEHAPPVRARTCEGLGFLGIEIDEQRNQANQSLISADNSKVAVRVIPTDEEQMIARSVCRALGLDMTGCGFGK